MNYVFYVCWLIASISISFGGYRNLACIAMLWIRSDYNEWLHNTVQIPVTTKIMYDNFTFLVLKLHLWNKEYIFPISPRFSFWIFIPQYIECWIDFKISRRVVMKWIFIFLKIQSSSWFLLVSILGKTRSIIPWKWNVFRWILIMFSFNTIPNIMEP